MAVGGSYKGNISNGNRGKPYGLMLLLAFGAALLGVMVIHKLRERRIVNLLVQDKDNQLITLNLLLKKEREYNKEMKKKTEEMKAKIYSLRTQKMELDRRVLEMQSTIDSLKDEQKTVESALEEKQSEIKMIRETSIGTENKNPPVIAQLTESLKQKEAEIEDLKHRLGYPNKIWSVSSDDPSNPSIKTSNTAYKDKIEINEDKEGGQLHDSYGNGLNSTESNGNDDASSRVENGSENLSTADKREDSEEEQTIENSAKQLRNDGVGGSDNIVNTNEAIVNSAGIVLKPGDVDDVKSINGEEHKITRDGRLGLENSQLKDSLDRQTTFKGGMKMEMTENSADASSNVKGKHARVRKPKGKRWKMVARNRWLENNNNYINNGAKGVRSRKTSIDGLQGREMETIEREVADSSNAKLLETQNSKNEDDLENKQVRNYSYYQMNNEPETQNREVLTKGNIDGKDSNISSNSEKQNLTQQRDQEAGGIQDSRNSGGAKNIENNAERAKVANQHDRPDEEDVTDREHEANSDAEDIPRESTSDLEDKEEYKGETDAEF